HAGAGFGDGAHHHRGLADAEAGAAIFLRDADAEPAILRHGIVELGREVAALVLLAPVIIVETGADAGDRLADHFLIGGEGEIHQRVSSSSGPGLAIAAPSASTVSISVSLGPASRRRARVCSPRRGAGIFGSGWVPGQRLGTRRVR